MKWMKRSEEGGNSISSRSGLVLGLSLGCALFVFCVTAWMADDAYITLRTVRNLLQGYGPVYNVGERVQAYTHPLWFFILASACAVTREMYLTPILLSVLFSLATIALLLLHTEARGWALGGVALLLASRSFVDYSTSGLENALSHLLVLGFFVILAEVLRARDETGLGGWPSRGSDGAQPSLAGATKSHDKRRLFLLSGCAGLAVLNRVDLALLLGPGIITALLQAWRIRRYPLRIALAALAAGFLPFVIWELFSLVYYGALVPNTAVAKLQSGIPAAALARQGLHYLANSMRLDPLTIPIIVAALLVALIRRCRWSIAAALGMVLYLAYVVRIGGDFMSGRFLSTVLVVSILVLVRSLPSLVLGRARVPVVGALALGAIVLVVLTPRPPGFFTKDFGLDKIGALDDHGISDERRYYYGQTGLRNGKPLAEKPGSRGYAIAGHAARRAQAPILPEGMIGVRGFQADARVHILDVHALSDPLLARLPCVRNDIQYEVFRRGLDLPPSREGWRIGHFLRNVPRGYLASLLTKEDRIEDPGIAALYREVHRITSGPLFAADRWAAILSAMFGGASQDAIRPEYQPIDYSELLALEPNEPEYLFRRAQAEYARGNFAVAEQDAERATELDALYTPALAQLAQIRTRAGDLERAIALLERVRTADLRDAQSRIDLGDLYLQSGHAVAAVRVYEEALTLEPTQPAKFYNSLGVAQAFASDEAAARGSFERALRLAPKQPEAYDNLAQLELRRGETAKACALYEIALTLEPDPSILLNAGIAFAEAGRMRESVPVLERAWSANRNDATVAFHLAQVLNATGDRVRAFEMLQAAAQLGHEGAQRELAVFRTGS